jgi:hypothetical protein
MNIHPIHFDKYVFRKGEVIPPELDLRGSIAVTRDSKHQTILHVIFFIAQKIHNFLFGRRDDANMAHWAIILEKSPHDPQTHHMSHSNFPFIQKNTRSYLNPNSKHSRDITELIIYIPKNPLLRAQIAQTAEETVREENKSPFSIGDIVQSFFNKPSVNPSKRTIRRTSLATADALHHDLFKNRRNQPRSLFCTAYASFIGQSSILINSLTQDEKDELSALSRDDLAKKLYKRIKRQNPEDALSCAYWQNPICRLNSRFAMSSFTTSVMDAQSIPKVLKNREFGFRALLFLTPGLPVRKAALA